jgi:pimeloyl-ACP methyl ester carboxylesterase
MPAPRDEPGRRAAQVAPSEHSRDTLGGRVRVVDGLARLVPNAQHIIATESGRNIHQDQPELVIAAIRDVVDVVRDPSTWATPTAGTPTP